MNYSHCSQPEKYFIVVIMEERFIYKTIKEAKVDYVLKGWSIALDQADAVVVSKQKKYHTSYMQS